MADSNVGATVSTVAPSLRKTVLMSDRGGGRGVQERDAIERSPEDLARVGPQVTAQNFLVHGAEVDRELEVAGRIEAGQDRRLAVKTALDRVADQEQRRGRPMVCLLYTSPSPRD